MRRTSRFHPSLFAVLALPSLALAWWGCASSTTQPSTGTTSSSAEGGGSSSAATGGAGGAGGDIDFDGGGTVDDSGACTSTSAVAEHIQLDMIFVIDRSQSMVGPKWIGTTAGLTTFFNDPASAKIGAGLSYFPNHNNLAPCIPEEYQILDVPINVLPLNAFPLINSIPEEATGGSTPTYGAVKGVLMAATAYQDAHPTHKVIVVVATDGEPNSCGLTTIDSIADLAKSARNYNGVLTYVIGVEGSILPNLHKIAIAGGTEAAYDITTDISQFAAKMNEIRSSALGCEFAIPKPPNNEQLDPDKVNFSYTPKGVGSPKVLLRANDLTDCGNKPGWYYDSNLVPTKIFLCPASCNTVQADSGAKVEVLFGCKSQVN